MVIGQGEMVDEGDRGGEKTKGGRDVLIVSAECLVVHEPESTPC